MNNGKIYGCQLRRTLLSKAYLFSAALVALYGVFLLKSQVIYGAHDTAPYSQWSFLGYIFSLAPLLAATVLIPVSKLYAPRERLAEKLLAALPFPPALYRLLRLAAVVTAYAAAAALATAICFLFYGLVFGFRDFHTLVYPILLTLPAQLLFLVGAGAILAQINHTLPLALLALIFITSAAQLSPPYFLDIMGVSVLRVAENAIPTKGVIPFAPPAQYLLSRAALGLAGLLLIFVSLRGPKKKWL